MLYFLGLFVALAFGQGMLDSSTAVRWAVLAVGIPLVFVVQGLKVPRSILWLAGMVVMNAGMTLFWTPDFLTGFDEFTHVLILAGAFCMAAAIDDLGPLWRGVAAGVAVSGFIALAQVFGLAVFDQVAPPAGLFMNKNMMAEAGAVAVIMCIAYRRNPVISLGCLLAWVLPASVAAYGGLWAAWALYERKRHPLLSYGALLFLAAAVIWAFTDHHIRSADVRLYIWDGVFKQFEWMGAGLGAFMSNFRVMEHAHMEALQLVYELGVVGCLPLVLIAVLAVGQKNEPEKSIFLCLCAISFFSFPFHLPLTAFVATCAAGRLVGQWCMVRSIHFGRGMEVSSANRVGQNIDPTLYRGNGSDGDLPAVFTSARGRVVGA